MQDTDGGEVHFALASDEFAVDPHTGAITVRADAVEATPFETAYGGIVVATLRIVDEGSNVNPTC